MMIRRSIAALALGAVTLGIAPVVAGAASSDPGFSVPRTTVEVGESLKVTITRACDSQDHYGSLNQYFNEWEPIAQRSYKYDYFEVGVSDTYDFEREGTYVLRNWCDGNRGEIVITVVAPAPTTTTSTTSTTVVEETTTTTVAEQTTTTASPTTAAPTTTAPAGVTTTTAAVQVAGATATNTVAAPGASATTANVVAYAG